MESLDGFSRRLKELRRNSRLTQSDLGKEIGIGQTAIANYETGSRFPDETILVKIADFFGVSLDLLIGRHVPQRPPEPADKGISYRPSGSLKALKDQYMDVSLHSPSGGSRFVRELLQSGYSEEQILVDLLSESLIEAGSRWAEGRFSEVQEHQISTAVLQSMLILQAETGQPAPYRGRLAAITAAGEEHNLGLRLISRLLELDGWESFFLGAPVPAKPLISFVDEMKIDLLLISVTMQQNTDSALGLVRAAAAAEMKPRVVIGGQAMGLIKEEALKAGAGLAPDSILKILELIRNYSKKISAPAALLTNNPANY